MHLLEDNIQEIEELTIQLVEALEKMPEIIPSLKESYSQLRKIWKDAFNTRKEDKHKFSHEEIKKCREELKAFEKKFGNAVDAQPKKMTSKEASIDFSERCQFCSEEIGVFLCKKCKKGACRYCLEKYIIHIDKL